MTNSLRTIVTTTYADGSTEATWHADMAAAQRHAANLLPWMDAAYCAPWNVAPYVSVTVTVTHVTED